VFLLKPIGAASGPELTQAGKLLSSLIELIHRNVHDYLKGGISIVSTYPGVFTADISEMYDQSILALRKQAGKEHGHLLQLAERPETVKIRPLSMLYAPPTFMHLLETSQWEEFSKRLSKLRTVFNKLPEQTEEHLEEVKSVLLSSFHYVAHKNHVMLSEWSGQQSVRLSDMRSFAQIQEWAEALISLIRDKLEKDVDLHQQSLIQAIKSYIDSNLAMVSLQAIADHVSLHPVYVSKLFRKLCDISISDYLLKLKMEHALAFLRDTGDKVYEISEKLGYSNSQYFIKVFKDYYGMTPQEFREKRQ
jgi:two-component system response regulator YesN